MTRLPSPLPSRVFGLAAAVTVLLLLLAIVANATADTGSAPTGTPSSPLGARAWIQERKMQHSGDAALQPSAARSLVSVHEGPDTDVLVRNAPRKQETVRKGGAVFTAGSRSGQTKTRPLPPTQPSSARKNRTPIMMDSKQHRTPIRPGADKALPPAPKRKTAAAPTLTKSGFRHPVGMIQQPLVSHPRPMVPVHRQVAGLVHLEVEQSQKATTLTQTQTQASAALDVYPAQIRATVDLSRTDVRNGVTDQQAANNGANRGFNYHLDAQGRVEWMIGDVSVVQRGNVGAWGDQICDVMFDPDMSSGTWSTAARRRDRNTWESGHIAGSALDGSDTDPINFFPQHYISNGGGRWHRMEKIAMSLKAACPAERVAIEPQLDYAGNGYWTPSDGRYFIHTTNNCMNTLAALNNPGSYINGFINNAYFSNNAFATVGTQGWTMRSDWSNDANDALQFPRDNGLY